MKSCFALMLQIIGALIILLLTKALLLSDYGPMYKACVLIGLVLYGIGYLIYYVRKKQRELDGDDSEED